jgi:hypothetical protein
MRLQRIAVVLVTISAGAAAQEKPLTPPDQRLYDLLRTDRKAFAEQASEGATSEVERAAAIVLWLTQHFDWKETDYRRRSVQEVIDRRGGNCNDLAMVALAAMGELHLQLRRVHEVHIRTASPDRGERAHVMVREKGYSASVFGKHHNDHVWLEIYDSAARDWFPADPWSGLVGLDPWMKARVWFGRRSSLNPDAEDMIVPFAIYAADESGRFTIDRTRHYLVDEFDRLYDGKLHKLPAWASWVKALGDMSDKARGALAGDVNLHEYEGEIDLLAATYEQLRSALSQDGGADR